MASQSVCYEGSEKPQENECAAIFAISSLHPRMRAWPEQGGSSITTSVCPSQYVGSSGGSFILRSLFGDFDRTKYSLSRSYQDFFENPKYCEIDRLSRPSSSVAEALEVFSLGFWLAHGTPAMCRSSIRITVEAYALFRYRASTVPNDLLHHWDS
jgi:hypothetical protein|tara:strand:+ start:571 stop:1035 length:465 start_codon:yes stop_codon:yes gene_type:complete